MKIELKKEEKQIIAIIAVASAVFFLISMIIDITKIKSAMIIIVIMIAVLLPAILIGRATRWIEKFLFSNKSKKKKLLLIIAISIVVFFIIYGLYKILGSTVGFLMLCTVIIGFLIIISMVSIEGRGQEKFFQYIIAVRRERQIKKWEQIKKTIKRSSKRQKGE